MVASKKPRVLVVRPYKDKIREEMFAALKALNLEIPDDHVVPANFTAEEILDFSMDKNANVILCPYHAGFDAKKNRITGIKILALLMETYPWVENCPVLMPISNEDLISFENDLPGFLRLPMHQRDHFLFLDEKDIFGKYLKYLIQNHLEKFQASGSSS